MAHAVARVAVHPVFAVGIHEHRLVEALQEGDSLGGQRGRHGLGPHDRISTSSYTQRSTAREVGQARPDERHAARDAGPIAAPSPAADDHPGIEQPRAVPPRFRAEAPLAAVQQRAIEVDRDQADRHHGLAADHRGGEPGAVSHGGDGQGAERGG